MSILVNIGCCCDILDEVRDCIFCQHEMKQFIHSVHSNNSIHSFRASYCCVLTLKGLKPEFTKEPPRYFKHGTPWKPLKLEILDFWN